VSNKGTCKILDCHGPVRCKGFCAYHYELSRREKLGIRCSQYSCERIVFSGGLCARHYQAKRNGYEKENSGAVGTMCAYPGCNAEVTAKRYCQKHYMRTWRHGDIIKDGYRKSGGKSQRHCLYCCMRVVDGSQLCGEHKGWPDACVVCGYARIVEAAHVLPRAAGYPKEDWNMMALCPNHHRLYDGDRLEKEEIAKIEPYVEVASAMLLELSSPENSTPG
jgi:hypothetical protein